jgi:hypothetical protein
MKAAATILLLVATALTSACVKQPTFTAPVAGRIAELLAFTGPVSLTQATATEEELARAPKREGVPVASFRYSDPIHTSDTIRITVYPAGTFLGEERTELFEWLTKPSAAARELSPAIGIFRTADGRSIYQFPLGFGPGGSAYGALLPCRDTRYELVLSQHTNFHDDEDPKAYSNHVSPTKELKTLIETIESLVFH